MTEYGTSLKLSHDVLNIRSNDRKKSSEHDKLVCSQHLSAVSMIVGYIVFLEGIFVKEITQVLITIFNST